MALTDSIALMGSQYAYNNPGPFDAKMLVAKIDDLINPTYWQNAQGDNLAYNGMIVSVYKNPDTTLNGIYYFHDGNKTNKYIDETIKDLNNWHKLANDTGNGGSTSLDEQAIIEIIRGLTANSSEIKLGTNNEFVLNSVPASKITFDELWILNGGTAIETYADALINT